MIGGLDVPTSGQAIIQGNDLSRMERDELTIFRRRKIGFVFQNYNLLPGACKRVREYRSAHQDWTAGRPDRQVRGTDNRAYAGPGRKAVSDA